MTSKQHTKIDVIIPTTGKRVAALEMCVKSLMNQTSEVNIIIVLGTHSFKILRDVVAIRDKYKITKITKITKLCEPYKPNIKGSHRAVACNHGLLHSHSSLVGFVDDDVIVPPTWAETSIKYFNDSNVAGVTSGCKPSISPFHLVQTVGSDAHSQHFTEPTKVKSIPGYNSIYRSSAIILVGGFNEHIGGCEDWELNHRLRKSGFRLLGIPETPVEHRHNYTYTAFTKQMFGYGWSRSRLLRTTRIFTPQHAIPTVGLLTLLILLFLNSTAFLFFTGAYILTLLTIIVDIPTSPATIATSTFQIVFTFIVMHISWALGYLKGLIE